MLHHYGHQQVKDAINGIDDAEVDQEMVLTDEERKKITDALQRKRKNYEQDENRKYFYRWDLFKQVGSMHVRYPVAGQYTDWVGLPNDSSEKCGFRDKASFERMNDFLEIAGPNRQLYHVSMMQHILRSHHLSSMLPGDVQCRPALTAHRSHRTGVKVCLSSPIYGATCNDVARQLFSVAR